MDLPKRKPTRLKNYDYSSCGAYFITICTNKKKNILCEIVGEGLKRPPVCKSAQQILNFQRFLIYTAQKKCYYI